MVEGRPRLICSAAAGADDSIYLTIAMIFTDGRRQAVSRPYHLRNLNLAGTSFIRIASRASCRSTTDGKVDQENFHRPRLP